MGGEGKGEKLKTGADKKKYLLDEVISKFRRVGLLSPLAIQRRGRFRKI